MVHAGNVLAGRYELEQRIASGGMGEVWRAFDRVLGRTVAVKRLLSALPEEPSFVDRFRAEARTMATISHPGVVEIYDFGDDPAAGMYLVMKYIDGESLARTLARAGRLSPERTMRLVAEAAEALHAAHERGVTHRDVKPGNLLMSPDGSALLTDFGIARTAATTGHSVTGSLAGTAGYLAPERAIGHPATARSDIYSLGIVAYQCLAGRLPFLGDSLVEVALRHVRDDPPPLPADVPPHVQEVVLCAMAKEPADRWPTAAMLATQARACLRPAVPHRQVTTPQSPQREVAVVAAHTERAAPPRSSATGDQLTFGSRGPRRMLVPAAAVAVALAITIGIALRGSGLQAQSLKGNDTITTITAAPTAAGDVTAAASLGAATASPGATAVQTKAGNGSAPPVAPGSLTATATGAGTIRLQWADISADEQGFTVTDGVTSRNASANATFLDWTGLPPATRSCFKVRAYNSFGVSDYHPAGAQGWVCATTLPGSGPAAPSNLRANPANPNTVMLTWTDHSSDEEGFTITDGKTSVNVGANVTGYDWNGLNPGTYVCFKVRSFKASGVSAYFPPAQSEWVCLTTPQT